MKQKTLYIVSTLLVLAMLLAACSSAATPTESTKPTQAPAEEKTEAPAAETEAPAAEEQLPTIVVACWSGPEHDNLVKVAADYKEITGNEVIVEEIARESYYDKLTTTFVAGGTDYDVAYVSSDWPPAWIKADALQDLNQFIDDPNVVSPDFDIENFRPSIDIFEFDGKVYALPSEGDTAWLFYRKDIFEENNIEVPQTWDDYLAAAKALNNPPEMYGTVIGVKPDEALWDFMHYLYGHGGEILDKDHKVILNNEAGVEALTFYANLLKDGLVPPDVTTYGYNEILTTLQEGKSAMGVEWMAATQTLQDCEQSPKVCKDGEPLLQYTEMPGIMVDGELVRGSGGSSWGWVIPSGAQNPEAAYKFIEWLAGKDGATRWALKGGIPSNTLALSDPEVVALVPQFALLAKVMPYRHLVPATTVTSDMVNTINEAVVAAVAGTKTPQEALDDAADKIQKMLTDAGY